MMLDPQDPEPPIDASEPAETATARTSRHPSSGAVAAAAERAGRKIAPLWPLRSFVAVNPFLGLGALPFPEAAAVMARTAGARMTMPRAFYARALVVGRITEADLAAARAEAGPRAGVAEDVATLLYTALTDACPSTMRLPTVADLAGRAAGRDWATFATERIAAWAAQHFDAGQAAWRATSRDGSLYAAWRADALIDHTPEVMGLTGFRRIVAALPDYAEAALAAGVTRLGLAEDGLEVYFHRLLLSVAGWAGYARHLVFQSELSGGTNRVLTELLAVRLAWDVALHELYASDARVAAGWTAARQAFAAPSAPDAALELDCLLQSAFERAWQREFLATLTEAAPPPMPRPAVQAAFCIDVRSEVFRRALEQVAPPVETLGIVGFFGVPVEYVPFGQSNGPALCPVLLTPRFTVRERVRGADAATQDRLLRLRQVGRRAAAAWTSFKTAAVSSFGFVETVGWSYAAKLAADALGRARPVPPSAGGARLGPELSPGTLDGRRTGLTVAEAVATAEGLLKALALRDFARLVVLVGHGATTANNPYAAALDCGACGGHSGDANARVAAAILNDPAVREGLRTAGVAVPADTVFVAAMHDTTTDAVRIFDDDAVPPSHAPDLARLREWFAAAGRHARAERAARLNLAAGGDVERSVMARSRDWSEVRPEWGLAGCAAFIAAPRGRTRGLDLGGRTFLHSYDWREDEGFAVLELVMTAPMIVASWISLQYYGSTVDNAVFGSGNKVLHNVVGTLGVLEGNGGDLRTGLPWQSVHDGVRLVHEPLRLSVVIEAPTEAIDAVVARHESVRQLVDNGWLSLFALSGEPGAVPVLRRYVGGLRWAAV